MEFGEGANQSNVRICSTVQDTDINSTCSTANYTASLVDQPIYYHNQGLGPRDYSTAYTCKYTKILIARAYVFISESSNVNIPTEL